MSGRAYRVVTEFHAYLLEGGLGTWAHDRLVAIVESACQEAFQEGVTEGRAAQAIEELQGRERFMAKLRADDELPK